MIGCYDASTSARGTVLVEESLHLLVINTGSAAVVSVNSVVFHFFPRVA